MNTPMQAVGWMIVISAGAYILLMVVIVAVEMWCGKGDRDKP